MDWSKAKNLIIGMLIAVNVFLLFVCFYTERTRLSVQETAVANAAAYLAERGIELDPTILPQKAEDRSLLLVERDDAAEAMTAEKLIGGSEVSRVGGIVRFSSADGSSTALWRAGGLFEASTAIPGAFGHSGALTSHPAVTALSASGISATAVADSSAGDLQQMILYQYCDGQPIFNASLTVTCGTQDVVYVAGRWCLGETKPISAADEMDLPGLLIRFAEQMSDSDADVSRIEAIRPGYIAQSIASAGVKLIPAWEITVPSGACYISAVDGTILVSE